MPNPIIISQSWGGLGDNLQFSTLPELYSNLGHDVYISSSNKVRNQEIYDLVWKLNPFVKGTSDLPPNAGECRGYVRHDKSCIKNMEICHGLREGTNLYPKIYYTPKLIPDLSNSLLYDLTSKTKVLNDKMYYDSFTRVFQKYPDLNYKKIVYSHIPNRSTPEFNTGVYTINSIYDLCDAIYSCKVFLCSFSGQSVLASAIKEDKEFPLLYSLFDGDVYNNPDHFGQMYLFPNTTYIM